METNTASFQDNTGVGTDIGINGLEKENLLMQISKFDDSIRASGTLNLTERSQVLKKDNSFAVNYEKTAFLSAYFSSTNVNNIQKLLKLNVYKQTNVVVDDQSVNELLLAMGRVYELHGRHPAKLESAKTPEELRILQRVYSFEINRLNELVVKDTLKQLIVELKMHLYYLEDLSTPRIIENPAYTTTSGERDYRSVIQTLTGTPDEIQVVK